MRVIKHSVVVIILLVLIAAIGYPVYLRVRQQQSRQELFNALTILQRAFIIAKSDEEKHKLNKALDDTEMAGQYLDEYEFKKVDNLSSRIYKIAHEITEIRKSAVMSGAHIAQLIGEVDYLEGGTRAAQAETNMKIHPGDVLTMKKGAGCEIIFIDGSSVSMHYPAAVIFHQIEENKDARSLKVKLELKTGSLAFTASKITDYSPSFDISIGNVQVLYSLNAMGRISRDRSILTSTVDCLEGSLKVEMAGKERILKPQQLLRISDNGETLESFTLPPMPLAMTPANFKTIEKAKDGQIQFQWSRVFNAAGYAFDLADNTVFAKPLITRRGYSGTSLSIPAPDKGVYYWRVAALNEANELGRFSDIREFKVVDTRKRELLVDQNPPPLTLERIRVFGTTAIVRGKTEPGALVTVNNQIVDVNKEGSFSAIITLYQSGKNRIEVIARDASDNETVVDKWVFIKIY